ncbi:MAG: PEP-CTERM sorting domain-containing protein, partial [Burkholderiales bacterium]
QAYAYATGLPSASYVSGVLAANPTVNGTFGATGFSVLSTTSMGGAFAADASGQRSYHSEFDLKLDTSRFTAAGRLYIGMLDDVAFFDTGGNAFDSLRFKVDRDGGSLYDLTFNTLGQAESFFNDKVRDLGAFDLNSITDLDFNFWFNGSTVGAGFGFDFLLGANSAFTFPPDGSIGLVPEPNSLALMLASLFLITIMRQRKLGGQGST